MCFIFKKQHCFAKMCIPRYANEAHDGSRLRILHRRFDGCGIKRLMRQFDEMWG